MKRLLIKMLGLTAVFLLITACNSVEAPTPTPFAPLSTGTPNIGAAQPLPVEFEDLVSNPIAYEGARIELSGRYKKIPLQICDGEKFSSPATWTLVNGTLIAPLNGFETQIEKLLPPDISMTVNGIWRRWRGPIGCGKNAVNRDIWYLEVLEISSPNPLVLVTLTPSGEEISDSGQPPTAGTPSPSEGGDESPSATETASSGSGSTITPRPTLTPLPTGSASTPTSLPSATPSDDSDDDAPTPTPTSSSNSGATPTVVPTSESSGATATPTPSSEAPLVTATPVNNENGTLLSDDLGFGSIASGTLHQWNFNLSEGEFITLTVAMEAGADASLTLINPDDETVIDNQNNSPAGQIESISNFEVSTAGIYELYVQSNSDNTADYVVNFYDSKSLPILVFEGFLDNDGTLTDSIEVDADDYWIIFAEEDEILTITVDPVETMADLFLSLWSKDGLDDNSESDEDVGETEIIRDYVIPHTGIYVLQIGEWDFESTEYTLTFEKQ